MEWYPLTLKYHELSAKSHYQLIALTTEWQRELAAIYRLEVEVNNGGYLQFVSNWRREDYVYALQGLSKIGATQMVEIIRECQLLIDGRFRRGTDAFDSRKVFLPNLVITQAGRILRVSRLFLSQRKRERILDLSYEFMDYPDDVEALGIAYYSKFLNDVHETGG